MSAAAADNHVGMYGGRRNPVLKTVSHMYHKSIVSFHNGLCIDKYNISCRTELRGAYKGHIAHLACLCNSTFLLNTVAECSPTCTESPLLARFLVNMATLDLDGPFLGDNIKLLEKSLLIPSNTGSTVLNGSLSTLPASGSIDAFVTIGDELLSTVPVIEPSSSRTLGDVHLRPVRSTSLLSFAELNATPNPTFPPFNCMLDKPKPDGIVGVVGGVAGAIIGVCAQVQEKTCLGL